MYIIIVIRDEYIKKISDWLSVLVVQVENLNSLNLNDLSIESENFFRDFLNKLYSYNLENVNFIEGKNADTLDLGDKRNRIAFQVTSNDTFKKIYDTATLFVKNKHYEDYDKLKFLLIKTKKKFPKISLVKEMLSDYVSFDEDEDILTISKILADIQNKTSEEIIDLYKYLETEFKGYDRTMCVQQSTEVETIMELIIFLTKNKIPKEVIELDPDPDKKIRNRFAEYSQILIDKYANLVGIYREPLEIAYEKLGFDQAKSLIMQEYLKSTSNKFLHQYNYDPTKALTALVEYFAQKLGKNGIVYDQCAIEFFLVSELIKCNVFPNEPNN